MSHQNLLQSLEARTLLSAAPAHFNIEDAADALVPGTAIGIGTGDPAEAGVDPNFGNRHHVTVIISKEFVTVIEGSREGNFYTPTVKSDGSVSLVGSSQADDISVQAVHGIPELDKTRTDQRIISFLNAKGDRQEMMGGLAPSVEADSVARQKSALDDAQARLDATSPGDTEAYQRAKSDLASHQQSYDYESHMLDVATNGDFVEYRLAGVYDYFVQLAPGQTAGRIMIDAGAGNDNVSVSTNVKMRTNIAGGSGADTLTSGKGATVLSGGGGNDRLISRSIHGGTLDGGKGADRYYNRAPVTAQSSAEVNVLARNDGDRVMVSTGAVPIARAGVFGASSIDRSSYYLVDGSGGQIDVLA